MQVEQLKQIGDYLLQVRENKAISLEKIANDTFIPLRLLQALEVGDIDRLPEPVYVKGFIRRYGDALGLDGTEIADAFEADVAPAKPVEVSTSVEPSSQAIPTNSALTEVPPSQAQHFNFEERSRFPLWAYVLSGAAALGVVGAIVYGFSRPAQYSATQSTPSKPSVVTSQTAETAPATSRPDASPQAEGGSPTVAASPGSGLSSPSSSTASNAPVKVDISLTDRSWMEVVADGKVEFEGILTKGEQRTWTAQNNLQIRAGNAGAVVASYNQGQAKPLGRLGDVVDASFSREDETPQSPNNP